MTPHHLLTDENIGCLEQITELLEHLEDAPYSREAPPPFNSTVGAHVRHAVDHYDQFLAGVPNREIDYQSRERDVRIAEDREYAVGHIRRQIESLRACAQQTPGGTTLRVRLEAGSDDRDAALWTESTLERELDFLLSHTIHHQALMAFLLKSRGTSLPQHFGMAPSTVRYEEQRA